jgi:extracellular factor (EF) 3-hydroxypalmitic acid methyl ester biosynthesis protein
MLKQHENFEVSTGVSELKWVVRQERFELADDAADVEMDGEIFRIINYSATGIVVVSSRKLIQPLASLTVRFLGNPIATISGNLIRSQATNGGKYLTSFEFKQHLFPIDQMSGLYSAQSVVAKYRNQLTPKVPSEVISHVLAIKDFLEVSEKICAEIESELRAKNESHHLYEEVEKSIVENIFRMIAQNIDSSFESLVKILPKDENQRSNCHEYMREKLSSILLQAAFANRAFSKPLGYAGDYQMMNMIYHRGRDQATNLFTKCLNQYFLTRPAAIAVKNRSQYLKSKILEVIRSKEKSSQTVKILSLASGPAQEVILALREIDKQDADRVELWLIDQDIESLRYAQRDLRRTTIELDLNPKIYFENTAIKNVLKEGLPVSNLDLIYSAGLFDYFTDPVVVMSAQLIMRHLRPGGRAIVGNFDSDNPTRPLMEAILDWNLIHRTEEEMTKLFSQASQKLKIEREDSKINLFVVMEK